MALERSSEFLALRALLSDIRNMEVSKGARSGIDTIKYRT